MKRYVSTMIAALTVTSFCIVSNLYAQDNILAQADREAGWQLLFDGKTLLGWINRGGAANWTVENGMIVGEKLGDSPGYIGTYGEYADFELHVEFMQDAGYNSGIFFRGPRNTKAGVNAAAFYEVNIADSHPSDFTTGSIVGKIKCEQAETEEKWNYFDIIAQGPAITVMLNGRETAKIEDATHFSGVIALQVFGEGKIRFKNIKIREL